MKKITLFLAALLAGSFAANAQMTVIPKIGLTVPNVSYDEDEVNFESVSSTGVVIGAGLEIPVADIFSFQPELLFIQKGYKIEQGGEDPKIIANYLELPLLGKVNFGTEQIKAFANIGPSFGFLAGVRSRYDGDSDKIDLDDSDKRLDISVQFGGGIGYGIGPGTAQVELRYGLGLTDTAEDINSKNRVFAIMFGYALPIGN